MPENEASFEFPTFKVQIRHVGGQDSPAYETRIQAPGFDPADSGVLLKNLPLYPSAARMAVLQFRILLGQGVKAFLDDYRKNSGVISLKEIQEKRLLFLSWHDMASAIGDEALATADAELKAQERVESLETYGEEQTEEELPEPDRVYDLGTVIMSVRVMGQIGIFPMWGVTATVPGSDLHANSVIGIQSPLAAHAVAEMVYNLTSMLNLGVDRYLAEEPRAQLSPITDEKRVGSEMVYAVASQIGSEGLNIALERAQEFVEEERGAFEEEALVEIEKEIAKRRKWMESK